MEGLGLLEVRVVVEYAAGVGVGWVVLVAWSNSIVGLLGWFAKALSHA